MRNLSVRWHLQPPSAPPRHLRSQRGLVLSTGLLHNSLWWRAAHFVPCAFYQALCVISLGYLPEVQVGSSAGDEG